MAVDIHKAGVRDELKPRREPYWGAPLEAGRYVGFRKLEHGGGTWVARMRAEDGKQRYKSLGILKSHDEAVKKARAWFAAQDAGMSERPPTVAEACQEYLEELESDGREQTAYDTRLRFSQHVYPHSIAMVRLDRIRAATLKKWRNELRCGPAAQDRTFRALKAALNLAVRNRRVSPLVAVEWKSVRPHKHAENRRQLFLDAKQRRRLVEAAQGPVRDLIEVVIHIGCRPGEAVKLRRRDFDVRLGTLRISGKTGQREIPLSPHAQALFTRLARGKLPDAWLLTQADGKPWTYSGVWAREVTAAARKAKLPKGVCLYTLRHSTLTEWLRAGMAPVDVAQVAGTSLAMLDKHYIKLHTEAVSKTLATVELL